MTLQEASFWAEMVTAGATFALSLISAGALWLAKQQLKQARHDTATEASSAIYRSLLEKAIEHPEFVDADESVVNTEDETFGGSQKEFRRYEAFVDLMLTTFERMLKLQIEDADRKYIDGWLYDHRTYLRSDYFEKNFKTMVSEKLWRMIKGANADG